MTTQASTRTKAPFAALATMVAQGHRGLSKREIPMHEAERDRLSTQLRDDWAKQYSLRQVTHGDIHWRRLLISQKSLERWLYWGALPNDDHCSLWRRRSGGSPVAWISQPYGPISSDELREMINAAERYVLQFTIDSWSWHYPGRTLFMVWTKKGVDLGERWGEDDE